PTQQLQKRGLLAEENGEILLTEAGHDKLARLLTATRANEAEALGTFSAEEALTLKSSLRRIIDWTSNVPVGLEGEQQSLKVGPVS
ncbi:MAG: DNA-binding MarR family transcriptional regulator, partial [Halioglobus sp.]